MSKSERICQQSGCSHLSDVSHAAYDDDTLDNNGKLEQKRAEHSLSDQKTSVKEGKILRKCKRNQKRGFVCNQIGEESDEDTLKRFVHLCISTLCAAGFGSLMT